MSELAVLQEILNQRRENLMLRIDNCQLRNHNLDHDSARLKEVESILAIVKRCINE